MAKLFTIISWLILLLLAGLTGNLVQEIFIIFSLFLFNYGIYKLNKNKIPTKLYLVSTILIAINIILVYMQYYNAVSLGYQDGLLWGYISNSNNTYSDTSNYYYEALQLSEILSNNFSEWIYGDIPFFGFYGPYNAFNIWNAFLIFIFGNDLISLILLKSHLFIISIYLLYLISINLLKKTYAIGTILIYNLYPGYLLVTSTLSRDDIVTFLILVLVFLFCKNKKTKLKIKFLLIFGLILFFFRNYAFAFLSLTMIFYYLHNNFSIKRIILSVIALLSVSIIILIFYGSDRIIFNILEYDGNALWNPNRSGGLQGILYTFYTYWFYSTSSIDNYYLFSVSESLNYMAQPFLNFFLPFNILGLIILFLYEKDCYTKKFLLYFGVIMPLLFLTLIIYIFGGIIPRLYNMWFWTSAIFYCYIMQNLSKNYKILSNIGIVLIIVLIYSFKRLFIM